MRAWGRESACMDKWVKVLKNNEHYFTYNYVVVWKLVYPFVEMFSSQRLKTFKINPRIDLFKRMPKLKLLVYWRTTLKTENLSVPEKRRQIKNLMNCSAPRSKPRFFDRWTRNAAWPWIWIQSERCRFLPDDLLVPVPSFNEALPLICCNDSAYIQCLFLPHQCTLCLLHPKQQS